MAKNTFREVGESYPILKEHASLHGDGKEQNFKIIIKIVHSKQVKYEWVRGILKMN
ncbi:MAG: hypothetical protein JHC28_02040 [Thermoprotei archaeon]|jgi:hypothetical protein|nr:hypothetical protein [Thermoprotei archaeon]